MLKQKSLYKWFMEVDCNGWLDRQAIWADSGHSLSRCGITKIGKPSDDHVTEPDCKPVRETSRQTITSRKLKVQAYDQQRYAIPASEDFKCMQEEEETPKRITFASILSVCTSCSDLAEGRCLHAQLIASEVQADIVLGTTLVHMYGKCGSLEDAQNIFDKMPERNVISWTAMIAAYVQHGQVMQAFQLFNQMHEEGSLPNKVTFVSMLNVCVSLASMNECKRMHARVFCLGFVLDVVVATSLVNLYGKCDNLEEAWKVFERMTHRNLFSWTAMLSAYSQHGYGKEALQLYDRMLWEGDIPDRVTFLSIVESCSSLAVLSKGKQVHASILGIGLELQNGVGTALIDMYGKCGSVEHAQKVFNEMPNLRDVGSWNTLMGAYTRQGKGNEAILVFYKMQGEGVMPNVATFVMLLDACASEAALGEGKLTQARAISNGLDSNAVVGTALVNMYGKCGRLRDAWRVFNNVLERDLVLWTAIISAYAHYGKGSEALHLLEEMQQEGLRPDIITFSSILSACSHAGLVEEAHHLFLSMHRDHGISPTVDHYSCVIDLLGRVGRLNEAENLLKEMPFEPTVVLWMTLLGACKNHVDVQRGEAVARQVFVLDPFNCASYVMLSSLYAAAGKGHDAANVMNIMRDNGLRKEPGISSIEISGSVHVFSANDQSHPQKNEIYAEVERLTDQIEEAGYVPDTNLILYGSEKLKKSKLSNHSERLAIAFGLISTPFGTSLLITKNLRVCSDCHTATKFISKVSHREIVVRDANRFHHIKDGICSCADYW